MNNSLGRRTARLERIWSGLSNRGKWTARAVATLVTVLAIWWVAAVLLTPAKKTPIPPVVVAKAVLKDVTVREHAVGTVVADATVNVTARVGGEIVAIGFKEGQDVRKGDVLFRLDPRPLQAALGQAEAALARDQATLVSNRRDADRTVALAAQNAVSAQARDQAVATAKASQATVAADRAAVETARLNLEYATIRSPVDGKTGAIAVQIGNQVVAGASTTLVTVTKDRPAKVSFELAQDRLAKIQKQMLAGKLAAEVTIEGAGDKLVAPVDFIGNEVNQSTGTIELRATFPNADRRLVPGQMVSVEVLLETLHHAVTVPTNAVNQGPDQNYVFVVRHDRVEQVPVRVLYGTDAVSAVAGKIRAGDLVVTDGQLRVVAGAKVRISGHGAGRRALTSPGAQ